MINLKRTKEKFSYEVSELPPTTQRLIVADCDECRHEVIYAYEYYNKKIARDGKIKCQKCSHSHRRFKASEKSQNPIPAMPLPPETDIEATIAIYGYDPTELVPWSRKRIVIRCSVTGDINHIKRCTLNRMKSVIETGHYISVAGATTGRRTGVKVSEETRFKMKESQIKRRQLEKEKNQLPEAA